MRGLSPNAQLSAPACTPVAAPRVFEIDEDEFFDAFERQPTTVDSVKRVAANARAACMAMLALPSQTVATLKSLSRVCSVTPSAVASLVNNMHAVGDASALRAVQIFDTRTGEMTRTWERTAIPMRHGIRSATRALGRGSRDLGRSGRMVGREMQQLNRVAKRACRTVANQSIRVANAAELGVAQGRLVAEDVTQESRRMLRSMLVMMGTAGTSVATAVCAYMVLGTGAACVAIVLSLLLGGGLLWLIWKDAMHIVLPPAR